MDLTLAGIGPALSPATRLVLDRLIGGPKNYPRVGSAEAVTAIYHDFSHLLEQKRTALVPADIAVLEAGVRGALRMMYVACPREVWWTAWKASGLEKWDPKTFESLEAARRANGMSAPWWRPIRRHRDRKDAVSVAARWQRFRPGDGWCRWDNFWLDWDYPVVSLLNLATAPISLPLALAWRWCHLRSIENACVRDFHRYMAAGRITPRRSRTNSAHHVYGFSGRREQYRRYDFEEGSPAVIPRFRTSDTVRADYLAAFRTEFDTMTERDLRA